MNQSLNTDLHTRLAHRTSLTGDKHTLSGLFRYIYRGFTVGNGVFLATR